MNLEPTNRHILVKPLETKEEKPESVIYLPDDYKKQETPYLLCEVLNIAPDSKFYNSQDKSFIGQQFLVERRMLQKIELQGNEFYLVLENYVLGRITNET